MSEAKYGEPLTFNTETAGVLRVMAQDGKQVITGTVHGETFCTLPLARMVACVNALATVPNPEALPKLLEACKRVEGAYEGYGAGNAPGDFWTALEMTCRAYRELMKEADDAPR